jgi:hypothetical protein
VRAIASGVGQPRLLQRDARRQEQRFNKQVGQRGERGTSVQQPLQQSAKLDRHFA